MRLLFIPRPEGQGCVSIHASRRGCDGTYSFAEVKTLQFQFTHPAGDATFLGLLRLALEDGFQFTHPLRDATLGCLDPMILSVVSIHASPAGCDFLISATPSFQSSFQFTHPLRDATVMTDEVVREHYKFQFTHPAGDATVVVR